MTAISNIDTLKAVADTLENAGKSDSGWILHHVLDGREIELPFLGYVHIPQFPLVFGIDITPTKHVVFMWIAAILVFLTLKKMNEPRTPAKSL